MPKSEVLDFTLRLRSPWATLGWITKWRREHPGEDITPFLNIIDTVDGKPQTILTWVLTLADRDIGREVVLGLVKAGADVNLGIMSGGSIVLPLEIAAFYYLNEPTDMLLDTIQALGLQARYGIAWRAGHYDVMGLAARRDDPVAASARVLAFAECVDQHDLAVWEAIADDPGAVALAHALNGFMMPYETADRIQMREAMRAWCGPVEREGNWFLTRPASVAEIIFQLQEAPKALRMVLRTVDPSQPGACGNNPAYHAFVALNAVPMYQELAHEPVESHHLQQAALAARSVVAARFLADSVAERIAHLKRETGNAATPVGESVEVEYLQRVVAAVHATLPAELRMHLYAALPDEKLVPAGEHVHRACSRPDHESFVAGLAIGCAEVLRHERPDLMKSTLSSAPGVSGVWQEQILDWVDRQWQGLGLAAPIRDALQSVARRRTAGAGRVSADMTSIEGGNEEELLRTTKAITANYDAVTARFCEILTEALLHKPPSRSSGDDRAVMSEALAKAAPEIALRAFRPLAELDAHPGGSTARPAAGPATVADSHILQPPPWEGSAHGAIDPWAPHIGAIPGIWTGGYPVNPGGHFYGQQPQVSSHDAPPSSSAAASALFRVEARQPTVCVRTQTQQGIAPSHPRDAWLRQSIAAPVAAELRFRQGVSHPAPVAGSQPSCAPPRLPRPVASMPGHAVVRF